MIQATITVYSLQQSDYEAVLMRVLHVNRLGLNANRSPFLRRQINFVTKSIN